MLNFAFTSNCFHPSFLCFCPAREVVCSVLLQPTSLMSYQATEAAFKRHKQAPENNWGLNTPQWGERGREREGLENIKNAAGEQTHILSGWLSEFGEQFYLSYQILSCISLFQSMRRTTASHYRLLTTGQIERDRERMCVKEERERGISLAGWISVYMQKSRQGLCLCVCYFPSVNPLTCSGSTAC